MTEVIRSDNGDIKAVCEFIITSGNEIDYHGEDMYILNFEISESYRGNGVIKQIISNILSKYPNAKRCTISRDKKYPGRKPAVYNRIQFEKLIKED
jgi:hypothetical protein